MTLQAMFTVAGVATDPTAATLTVEKPDGSTTSYTAGQLAHPTVGTYTVVVSLDQHGPWYWRAVGTGTAQTTGETAFTVLHSRFA